MKTRFECIPCILRQTTDAISLVAPDEDFQERMLRQVLGEAAAMDLRRSPPEMAQRIHRRIRERLGDDDPYREVKNRFNRLALDLLPMLRERVRQSHDPFAAAVRLAIAGNVIDSGANSRLNEAQVRESIQDTFASPIDGNVEQFSQAVSDARRILYLADNAGEIFFDRLLIEQLPTSKTTVAVRGFPVINDALSADADAAGLPELVEVVENGSDAPGTILDDCSEAFRRLFEEADLIVSKGQGNYETLSDVCADVFFLLKVKCGVVAESLDCPIGTLVLHRSTMAAGAVELRSQATEQA